jgi:hypothetical protein
VRHDRALDPEEAVLAHPDQPPKVTPAAAVE